MKRAALDRNRTINVWRDHARIIHQGDTSHCICDRQPGRFRKRKAGGCGRSRCLVCHYEKIFQVPTKKELIIKDMERDGYQELAAE